MKSEPSGYSIYDLKQDKVTAWTGVRNYQARNHMRDGMKKGDLVLFYHSSNDVLGIAGLASVVSEPHPDVTAFDKKSQYFDPKSKKENPTWICVDIGFVKKFKRIIPLEELKNDSHLKGMLLTRKGYRLSVQPVEEKHFKYIVDRLM